MTWLLWKVVVPILILGILILIHELGHFLLAKKCKVGVVSFSIGFGPAILKKKVGHTVYKIGPIPLGGYVQMVGEDPSFALDGTPPVEVDDKGDIKSEKKTIQELRHAGIPAELLADKSCWFINKTLLQRTAVVVAGPLFNLISAYIFVLVMLVGYGDETPNPNPVIGNVAVNDAAAQAGLKSGDVVRKMNGAPINKWEEFSSKIRNGNGEEVVLVVERKLPEGNSEQLDIKVVPRKKKLMGQEVFLIGVRPEVTKKTYSLVEGLTQSAVWVYEFSFQTLKGLGGMFIGQVSPKELAGPLAILDAAGDHAETGFSNTLYFMAILSVSLAILNLLPIPILDGGHLLFFLIEAIFGPVSIKKREIANQVGLAVLLLFMGVALTNDVKRVNAPKEKADGGMEWSSEKPAEKAK